MSRDALEGVDPSYFLDFDELEIISPVGAGAFAEVYEALRAGERVAVKKLINQAGNEKAIKELKDEVLVMSKLHSSYICGLYGACFKPPNMCMVMEFLPNGSLNHLLYDVTQEVSWDRRWQYARDAAIGLNYLHLRNPPVLHRDLKSGNLLLSEDGKVKITDFGLSIYKGSEAANSTEFGGGTERWTAPELLSGEPYTEAADVFSYGIILFEIAARKLPFDEKPAEEVPKLYQKGLRPAIPDDTPPDFERLIKMCWDQQRYNRPTFKEVVAYFRRKGKISTVSTERSQGRMADEKEKLERENEILQQLKENLEKKRDEADRLAERERKKRVELEEKIDEAERKLSEEKAKRMGMEKENQELSRSLRTEVEKVRQLEDAKKDLDKKVKNIKKKAGAETREELERAMEEADKRVSEERGKLAKLKVQLDEAERKAEEEEAKRIEAEKKIAIVRVEVEEERKKREEIERQREAAEKKVKQEKRKAEAEKKRREELEAEIEEEQKRRRDRRRAGLST